MNYYLLSLLATAYSVTVTSIPITKNPPGMLVYSNLAYLDGLLYSFGGTDGTYTNELRAFNMTSGLWEKFLINNNNAPSARINTIFFSYDSKLYIYGGELNDGFSEELQQFNPTNQLWKKLTQYGDIPPIRTLSAFTVVANYLIIFGGTIETGFDSSLYRLDLETCIWTFIPTFNTPSKRSAAGLVYFDESLYMWGGSVNDNNLYQLNLTSFNWSIAITTGYPPTSRLQFPYFKHEEYLYILPGFNIYFTTGEQGCFRISLLTYEWENFSWDFYRIVSAYVTIDDYLVLLGGLTSTKVTNEMIVSKIGPGFEFSVLSAHWFYPPARLGHSFHRSRDKFWVFGGESSGI